jgi:hypothetical protein
MNVSVDSRWRTLPEVFTVKNTREALLRVRNRANVEQARQPATEEN